MNSCIPDTSYFATPEFLSLVLHCMSVIEIPIHLFAAWIIIYYTPSSMASVKWPLLNLHFWSSFLDISISFLTIPLIIFPAVAGFPLGILGRFPSTVSAQIHVIVTTIGVVTVSMITVYENRYFLLSRNQGFWKRVRIIYLIVIYLMAFSFLLPFTLTMPDQKEAVKKVFENLPCLPNYVYEGPVFVYMLDPWPCFFTFLVLLILILIAIVIFTTLTVRNLLGTTFVSTRTLSLQKKFLLGLVIQTTIPLVVFSPILYLAVSVPQGYYNQALNNSVIIVFSLHGLVSTIAMLSIHQPYRNATLCFLFPCGARNLSKDTLNNTTTPIRKMTGKLDCVIY